MKDKPTSLAAQVRALFEQDTSLPMTGRQVADRLGADNVRDRERFRDTVSGLVQAGYLVRDEAEGKLVYRYSGQGMRREVRSEEERNAHRRKMRRERDRVKRAADRLMQRDAHVSKMAGMIPKPVLTAAGRPDRLETSAEFEARGGVVERLTAHWEQEGRAA